MCRSAGKARGRGATGTATVGAGELPARATRRRGPRTPAGGAPTPEPRRPAQAEARWRRAGRCRRRGAAGRGRVPTAVAAEGPEAGQLGRVRDPVGGHHHVEPVGQRDHVLDDRGVLAIEVEPGDQRLVEHDLVEPCVTQLTQRGPAAAETVEHDLDAARAHVPEHRPRVGNVGADRGRVDDQAQLIVAPTRRLQGAGHLIAKRGLGDQPHGCRHLDLDGASMRRTLAPTAGQLAGPIDGLHPDRHDQTDGLQIGGQGGARGHAQRAVVPVQRYRGPRPTIHRGPRAPGRSAGRHRRVQRRRAARRPLRHG